MSVKKVCTFFPRPLVVNYCRWLLINCLHNWNCQQVTCCCYLIGFSILCLVCDMDWSKTCAHPAKHSVVWNPKEVVHKPSFTANRMFSFLNCRIYPSNNCMPWLLKQLPKATEGSLRLENIDETSTVKITFLLNFAAVHKMSNRQMMSVPSHWHNQGLSIPKGFELGGSEKD